MRLLLPSVSGGLSFLEPGQLPLDFDVLLLEGLYLIIIIGFRLRQALGKLCC